MKQQKQSVEQILSEVKNNPYIVSVNRIYIYSWEQIMTDGA